MSDTSGAYDAASVVGLMAGLDTGDRPDPVTPDDLAHRFGTSSRERLDDAGCTVYRGFCGLSVIGNRDRMVSGFDDGYDFMGYLSERGWRPLASKGDWPYVVYLAHPAKDGQPPAIANYIECDFALWVFDSTDQARAFLRTLPECD